MTVSRLECCQARIDADVGRRLVDAKTEAGNLDSRIRERKKICDGELGGRHGGLGIGIGIGVVVCFSCCSAFVCGLKLGRQRLMVRMNVLLRRITHNDSALYHRAIYYDILGFKTMGTLPH